MSEAQELIKKLRDQRTDFKTRADVEFVLSFIAPKGEKRDIKRQIVSQLFTATSPQGFRTVDDIESYEGY